jgi:hypothetical protein
MKKRTIWMWVLIIPLSAMVMFSACKDDDDEEECPTVDYTELDATIAEAQSLYDNAEEGTEPGDYVVGSKADLQDAIDLAQQVRDKDCVTQSELDNAVVALDEAIIEFQDQKITDVNPGALVAQWLFNGDATDASGNGHDGTPSAGHENWGGGMPELATDRHGNADYCYKFMDGGNIVVPNSNAFRPAELTISVWMNLYETWAHSYFISNDIWHCWKFQVQDANKPFFTAHIMKDDGSGEDAYIDKDSNAGILELNQWYHVVLTYTSGKMIFYIDGVKVQEWDDFPTGEFMEPHEGIDLCIGQALATDDFDDGDHEWKEWLGYFKGYLDDMRIYNEVLTDAQIISLFQYEHDNTIE